MARSASVLEPWSRRSPKQLPNHIAIASCSSRLHSATRSGGSRCRAAKVSLTTASQSMPRGGVSEMFRGDAWRSHGLLVVAETPVEGGRALLPGAFSLGVALSPRSRISADAEKSPDSLVAPMLRATACRRQHRKSHLHHSLDLVRNRDQWNAMFCWSCHLMRSL